MSDFQQLTISSLIAIFLWVGNKASAHEALPIQISENQKETYVFSDKCPNGTRYRLFFYQAHIDGGVQSFYDYEGPAGRGTVKTSATPRTMAVRVCRALAEIASDQL